MANSLQTIVVTGATGFVGRYVVERLLQEDVKVKCLIRNDKDRDTFDPNKRLSFKVGDITDIASLKKAFKGAWGVINLAGLREFWTKDRDQFYALNHTGAVNVFEACLMNDIEHVVQVSTPLAFGAPRTIPFNEQTPAGLHPSDYGRSKHLGDQAGLKLHREQSLPLTVVYLAAVIGAGDDKQTMEVARAVNGNMPALIGADTTYTYVYVRDAAESIVRAVMKKKTIGKEYLIGTERATTREYFNIIGDLAHVKTPTYDIPVKYLVPFSKMMESAAKLTGQRPMLPLDVLKVTLEGSLLFDASLSEKELGMAYTPLEHALKEAVEEIQAN